MSINGYLMNELDIMRGNTAFIIKMNPCCLALIREEAVTDSQGNIVSYEKVELRKVIVRLANLRKTQIKETLLNTVDIYKMYSLTAYYYEDIRVGDILKSSTGLLHKVIDIESITLAGEGEEYCYKKSGLVELI